MRWATPRGALADLKEAVKAQPGSAMIHEHIGDLKKARGNMAHATKAYETASQPKGCAASCARDRLPASPRLSHPQTSLWILARKKGLYFFRQLHKSVRFL